jgi:hypothetical protein
MRKLLRRWYVWLGLVLLLGLAGSVALVCSDRGRITLANFDRIHEGMTLENVEAILGASESWGWRRLHKVEDPIDDGLIEDHGWRGGPNWMQVGFVDDRVHDKQIYLPTALETLRWYAKKGAAKIGVKWD